MFCWCRLALFSGLPMRTNPTQMLRFREPFPQREAELPITIIHGDTATPEPVFAKGRLCVDTGARATGKLSALGMVEGTVPETRSV